MKTILLLLCLTATALATETDIRVATVATMPTCDTTYRGAIFCSGAGSIPRACLISSEKTLRWVPIDGVVCDAEGRMQSASTLRPSTDTAFSIGHATSSMWDGCWLDVSPKGDIRVRGEKPDACVAALETAARLAKAEKKVNRRGAR